MVWARHGHKLESCGVDKASPLFKIYIYGFYAFTKRLLSPALAGKEIL